MITLNISPVDGRKTRVAKISLEGLKVRGNKTNRVGLRFYMEDANAVQIEITDKGFGESCPLSQVIPIFARSLSSDRYT